MIDEQNLEETEREVRRETDRESKCPDPIQMVVFVLKDHCRDPK
jgi:hypothetical protein